uniref:Uncharacterized protein n=1 Tax=uncultured Aminicenantes bacterium TaxID=174294 RepID=Q2YZZ6_9BACT|nr:hypothetical protein [uncultured Aminicenantes bacterium]
MTTDRTANRKTILFFFIAGLPRELYSVRAPVVKGLSLLPD